MSAGRVGVLCAGLATGGLMLHAAGSLDSPLGLVGGLAFLTSGALLMGTSAPARQRDDFGRLTSSAHPFIVPVQMRPDRDLQQDVELLGADAVLARCTLLSGPCPDPGHPGGMPIALWAAPPEYGRINVLECFNGTRGPDGLFERLALGVSVDHRTPLEAAAASYGVSPQEYAQLARRS